MRIGGFQRLTLVDYPGLIAATVFTQGCNFRCSYCHNPTLVIPDYFQVPVSAELILDYLNGRKGKLEGVVISGGEPTLQKDLADFIARINGMGFKVKLDTNGSHPEVVSSLIQLKLLDYIAMDIKSSLKKYDQIACVPCDRSKIQESIHLIMNSGIPYQFRTTLVKKFCREEDLNDIQFLLGDAKNYALQPFIIPSKVPGVQFDPQDQYTNQEVEMLKAKYERVL